MPTVALACGAVGVLNAGDRSAGNRPFRGDAPMSERRRGRRCVPARDPGGTRQVQIPGLRTLLGVARQSARGAMPQDRVFSRWSLLPDVAPGQTARHHVLLGHRHHSLSSPAKTLPSDLAAAIAKTAEGFLAARSWPVLEPFRDCSGCSHPGCGPAAKRLPATPAGPRLNLTGRKSGYLTLALRSPLPRVRGQRGAALIADLESGYTGSSSEVLSLGDEKRN